MLEVSIGALIMFWGVMLGATIVSAHYKKENHKVDIKIHDKPKTEGR